MSEEALQTNTIVDSYPLSPIQEGMLFHSLYAHRSGVDVEQMVCSLSEPIDAGAMERAWQAVANRHPVLRTSFDRGGTTGPMQRVQARAAVPFQTADWREFDSIEQKSLDSCLQTDGGDSTSPVLPSCASRCFAAARPSTASSGLSTTQYSTVSPSPMIRALGTYR